MSAFRIKSGVATPRAVSRAQRLACGASLVLAVACQRAGEEPKLASSSEQAGYAERYPDELQRVEGNVSKEHSLGETFGELKKFPADLNETDWHIVHDVYAAADEEGRSQGYADHYEEEESVARFFDEEKKPLVNRISGSVTYAAQEKHIEDFQPYGPVNFGMEKGVEQQLEDRRRANSGAQLMITDNEAALGKKNVPALQKQVDALSLMSHLVHVRVVLDEQKLSRMVDESGQVRSTLEDRKEELSKAEKPNKEAIARVDAALATLDERVQKAKTALEGAEQRRQQLQKDYQTAFDALQDDVSNRASAAEK